MKLNKYFLIGAMGLGLFACSDDLDGNGQDNGNKVQEGTTYAAFTLKFGNGLSSRNVDGAYDQADTKPATAALEEKINTVCIVVISDDDKVESVNWYEDVVDNEKTYTISMTPGAKEFYAIINEDAAYTGTKGSTKDDFIAYLTGTPVTTGVGSITSSTKGFMMSNVEVVKATITADVSKDQAHAKNPVEIKVDRVAAKATVKNGLADNYEFPDGIDKIGNIEFALGNADLTSTTGYTSTGSYRMQIAGTATGRTIAETPYSAFVPEEGAVHTTPSSAEGQNEYVSILDETYPRPLYCLENTHSTYTQGNTTYAAIRVPILLNKVVDLNVVNGAITVGENDREITQTTAEGFYWIYAPNAYRGKYILASDINKVISEVEGVTADNVIEKIGEVIPGFSMSKEYTGGYGYYKAWLNTKEDPASSPVYRNNWYELTITKLTLPGEPGEPVIVPEEPLNPDTYAEITVAVRNWNKVTNDIEL